LGIPDLAEMNLCLLASWIKRYHLSEDKLWKQIVENKYNLDNPNLFSCTLNGASPFWKGVMWAARAAKMGYQWKVGNGRSIKFWEDHWFGSCSLAIQYWELYFLVNEQNRSIADLWDGSSLKVTFRRCFDHNLMLQWFEIQQIAQTISFDGTKDSLIWNWEANGIYSVKSMYAVINFGGIKPVNIHCVWKIKIPPKIHFFLWLLFHNKLLTRDNLVKRQNVDDLTCVFCNELESCQHLFFDCVVASELWKEVCSVLEIGLVISNMHVVSSLWEDKKKNNPVNMIFAAVLRTIWITRNDIVFNRSPWLGMQGLWRHLLYNVAQWKIMLKEEGRGVLAAMLSKMGG
jgi:hypothetical protein